MEENKITEKTENYRNPDGTFTEGNPGRPKGTKNFTTKVREALLKVAEGKDYTYEEAYLKAILKKAIIDQDTTIMKLIWNYLDGMPNQNIDMDIKRDEPDIREIYKELKQKANDDDKTKTADADNKSGQPS